MNHHYNNSRQMNSNSSNNSGGKPNQALPFVTAPQNPPPPQ